MGISPFALQKLLDHRKSQLFSGMGSIIQLGRQYIANGDLCRELFALHEIDVPPGTLSDNEVFKALGFSEVASLDISGYQGATHVHDLNLPLDRFMEKRFDLVYDGGTLEHVFDTPQALRNIFGLLKVGGIVIHASPSNNHVDHGFYQYSPTLFWDYYGVNGWKIIGCYFFEYSLAHDTVPWKWFKYSPGALSHISFGGLGSALYGVWFVARKTEMTTCDRVPQQGECRADPRWVQGLDNPPSRASASDQ